MTALTWYYVRGGDACMGTLSTVYRYIYTSSPPSSRQTRLQHASRLNRRINHQRNERVHDLSSCKQSGLARVVIDRCDLNCSENAISNRKSLLHKAKGDQGISSANLPTSAPITSRPSKASRIESSSRVVQPPTSAVPVAVYCRQSFSVRSIREGEVDAEEMP